MGRGVSESMDEFPFFSCAIGLLIHFLPDFPSNSSLLQKVREDSLDALLAASDAAIAMSQHTLTGFSGGDAGADEVRRLWGGGGGGRCGGLTR